MRERLRICYVLRFRHYKSKSLSNVSPRELGGLVRNHMKAVAPLHEQSTNDHRAQQPQSPQKQGRNVTASGPETL